MDFLSSLHDAWGSSVDVKGVLVGEWHVGDWWGVTSWVVSLLGESDGDWAWLVNNEVL